MASLFVALVLVLAPLGQSQLGTGTINGIIEDSTSAIVPDATISVRETATGITRTLKTNESGQFNVPVVPPGDYLVIVEKPGFAKVEQANLTVTVGRTTTLRIVMHPGAIDETVSVTAESPLLDTAKTEETSLIDRMQIDNLPINGRRADQFALLTPGVTKDGRFGLLSYRGQAGIFNNFTLEGNDDNQALFSEARGRTRIASSVSANAIREFQVSQSNFLPEYGRSAGGGINAVIRSGGNDVHGDAFWYFRNDALNARDPLSTSKGEERRQQFGGSFSGPIIPNRVFYFFNYEQQLRNFPLLTQDSNSVLFNQASSDQTDPAFLRGCNEIISRLKAVEDFKLNPSLHCGERNQFMASVPRNQNQNLVLGKVDASLNNANQLSITHNYLNARGKRAIQTPIVLPNFGRNGSDDVRIHSFNTRLTSTISSSAVNEARVHVSRDWEFEFADQAPPQVTISGGSNPFSYGRATFLERPAYPDEKRLQFVDNLSYTAGSHFLKFGIDVNHVWEFNDNPANFGGQYTYANTRALGLDLLGGTNIPAGTAGNYTSYAQSFGLASIRFGTTDYAFFTQDQWKHKRLTLNYGLRYDYQQFPKPQAPNPAFPETTKCNADRSDYGPRIGVAYDGAGNGRTVLRGGFGLYYGRSPNGMLQNALQQTGLTDPKLVTLSISLTPRDGGAP